MLTMLLAKQLARLYFAASKMPHQLFFDFSWNCSSVLTGYIEE